MNTKTALKIGVALALAVTGCAGGRTTIIANHAQYPISMSDGVRDHEGELVTSKQREVVGTFEAKSTAWGMFYSAAKLTPKTEISKEVNRQVSRVKGDAIVNLSVSTAHCGWDYVPLFNFLPTWPGCTNVRMRGDIVRAKPKAKHALSSGLPAQSATQQSIKSAAR